MGKNFDYFKLRQFFFNKLLKRKISIFLIVGIIGTEKKTWPQYFNFNPCEITSLCV